MLNALVVVMSAGLGPYTSVGYIPSPLTLQNLFYINTCASISWVTLWEVGVLRKSRGEIQLPIFLTAFLGLFEYYF